MSRKPDNASSTEDDVLRKGVRQIVLSRETIPRAPRWARAFRRTLFRFVHDIAEADAAESGQDIQVSEENRHDQR